MQTKLYICTWPIALQHMTADDAGTAILKPEQMTASRDQSHAKTKKTPTARQDRSLSSSPLRGQHGTARRNFITQHEGAGLRDNSSSTTTTRCAGQMPATGPQEAFLAAHQPCEAKTEETFPLLPNTKATHRRCAQRLRFIHCCAALHCSNNDRSSNRIRRSIDCTLERDSSSLHENASSSAATRWAGQLPTAGPDEAPSCSTASRCGRSRRDLPASS